MRLLSLVILSSLSVGCLPSSPKTSSAGVVTTSAAERISQYESLYKTTAESLEDTSSFKINPCRDTAANLAPSGTSGSVDFDGHSFDYDFSNGMAMSGDCQVDLNPSMVAYRRTIKLANPSASIQESGDYTVISLVKNAGLVIYGEFAQAHLMSMSNSESAFIVEFTVREVSEAFQYLYINRYRQNGNFDDHQVLSVATFERSTYLVDSSIKSNRLGSVVGSPVLHPSAISSDVGDIKDFRIQEAQITLTGDETQGLYYFAVYPSVLTAQEKITASCHAMYVMAKAGNTDLLMQNLSYCGLN
jgi:hypothetical protein